MISETEGYIVREEEFIKFLENDPSISSKEKAVRSRLSKARKVERELDINLDSVVIDDELTYRTLLRIQEVMGDRNGSIQNSVRKYYLFINGEEFPTIKEYERRQD